MSQELAQSALLTWQEFPQHSSHNKKKIPQNFAWQLLWWVNVGSLTWPHRPSYCCLLSGEPGECCGQSLCLNPQAFKPETSILTPEFWTVLHVQWVTRSKARLGYVLTIPTVMGWGRSWDHNWLHSVLGTVVFHLAQSWFTTPSFFRPAKEICERCFCLFSLLNLKFATTKKQIGIQQYW